MNQRTLRQECKSDWARRDALITRIKEGKGAFKAIFDEKVSGNVLMSWDKQTPGFTDIFIHMGKKRVKLTFPSGRNTFCVTVFELKGVEATELESGAARKMSLPASTEEVAETKFTIGETTLLVDTVESNKFRLGVQNMTVMDRPKPDAATVTEAQKIFSKFDSDKDGSLTAAEMNNLNMCYKRNAAAMMNLNGNASFDEFLSAYAASKPINEAEVDNAEVFTTHVIDLDTGNVVVEMKPISDEADKELVREASFNLCELDLTKINVDEKEQPADDELAKARDAWMREFIPPGVPVCFEGCCQCSLTRCLSCRCRCLHASQSR